MGMGSDVDAENPSSSPYKRPTSFITVSYAEAPAWLATNRYILTGYRVYFSFSLALASLLRWHNETMNIWTHIVASALAVYLLVTLPPYAASLGGGHYAPFALYLAAGVAAFVASSTYHTFSCCSQGVSRTLARLDYMGIALLMTAAFMPGIHFGFACYPILSLFYQLLIGFVALAALALMLSPSVSLFYQGYYTRLALYTALAALSIVPISHWVYIHGADSEQVHLILGRMLVLFAWLALAAVIFVFQIPERWAPGTFDSFGHSHMIWHIIALGIFLYHLNSAVLYLHYTIDHPCPKFNPLSLVPT